jgi:EmrB/QacA subfamily drug resistance transporter
MAGRRLALIVLCTADVLVALDGMIVTVALPSIQRDIGFSAAALQWVVTAYTLTLGSFLLLGGRLADRFGARRTLLVGLAVFAAGSMAAGLARTPAVLLAARALTGLGAATAIPAALALIAMLFDDEGERHRALGWQSAGMDVGLVAGAVLGGVITSALGWPAVFLVAVPAGVAALAITPRVIAPRPPEPHDARLDVAGAILAAAGLALLIWGVTRAESQGPAAAVWPVAASLALLCALVLVERRAADPLVPAALLRDRRVRNADLAIVANAGAFGGTVFVATLHMQRVLGYSAVEAGLGFVPMAIAAAAGGLVASRLVDRLGVRDTVAASLAITAACLAWLAEARPGDAYATAILPAFAISGATFATAAVPLTAEAVAGPADKGAAAGLFQTFTHAGGAVVLAAVASVAAWLGYGAAFASIAALLLAGAVHCTLTLRGRFARAGC